MDRGFVRAVFVCTGLLAAWLRGADSAPRPGGAPLLEGGGAGVPALAALLPKDPITALDHGALVLRAGEHVGVTPELARADELALNGRLIAWLLARVQPQDRAHVEAVNARIGAACATSRRLRSACREDSSLDRQKEPS